MAKIAMGTLGYAWWYQLWYLWLSHCRQLWLYWWLPYGVYGDLVTKDAGNYAIYGYGTDAIDEIGTGYEYYQTMGAVKGYNPMEKNILLR